MAVRKMTPEEKTKAIERVKKRIAECKECNGQPPLEAFNIPEFSGTTCTKCGIISNFEK